MKVNSEQHNESFVVGSTQKINSFTLSNSKEFFDILSKNLYSNPTYAVVRELMCNAWDAHIKAGKTEIPIKASYDGYNFIVEDFGTGIPHEDIPSVYAVFGGSTKVFDNTQTGGFGLGCKAPFAVSESFTVQNIYDGIKGIYTCIKNDIDNNGLPSIRCILQVPTKESNGIKVTVPMNACKLTIDNNIKEVAYLGGILINDNKEIELPREKYFNFYVNNIENTSNQYFIRYGNVVYPINNLDKILGSYSRKQINISFLFEAEPNTLSIAPSRETLIYDDKTIETIKELFKKLNILVQNNYKKVYAKAISVLNSYDLLSFFSYTNFKVKELKYINFYKYYEKGLLTKEETIILYKAFVDDCRRVDFKYLYNRFPSCINKAIKVYAEKQDNKRVEYIFKRIFKEDFNKVTLVSTKIYKDTVTAVNKNTLNKVIKKYDSNECLFFNKIYLTNKTTNLVLEDFIKDSGYLVKVSSKNREKKEEYYKKLGFEVSYIDNTTEPVKRNTSDIKNIRVLNSYYNTNEKKVDINKVDCYVSTRGYNKFDMVSTLIGSNIEKLCLSREVGIIRKMFDKQITCAVASPNKINYYSSRGIPIIKKYFDKVYEETLNDDIKNRVEKVFKQITRTNYSINYYKVMCTNRYFYENTLKTYFYYLGVDDFDRTIDLDFGLTSEQYKEFYTCCRYFNDKLNELEFTKDYKRFMTRVYLSNISFLTPPPKELSLKERQLVINIMLRNRR